MNTTKQSILFHKRPITDLRFHRDGDIFFASSKDTTASMINLKGEIIGSFEKHEGAISTLASKNNSLITCGLDLLVLNWDILKGEVQYKYNIPSVIRGIDYLDNIYFCTDDSMNKEAFLGFIDPRTATPNKLISLDYSPTKLFKFQDFIIFSDVDGNIHKFDIKSNKLIASHKFHQSKISNIRPSACRSFFSTASDDLTAKIIDSDTFAQKKRFECEEPINCSSIFPTNDKLIAVGGINARDVTTTKGKAMFETMFFDIVTQNKIGVFQTHFGTINSVDIHPKSKYYCSGGEDGSICLVKLGKNFFDAPFTKFDD